MIDPSPGTQITGAMAIIWAIQELKRAGWFPLLTDDTRTLNRIASALGALLAGAAIHWNWDGVNHVLTISGLTATAIATFLWQAFQQFIGQELLYQVAYAPKATAKDAARNQMVAQAVTVGKAAAKVTDAIEHVSQE